MWERNIPDLQHKLLHLDTQGNGESVHWKKSVNNQYFFYLETVPDQTGIIVPGISQTPKVNPGTEMDNLFYSLVNPPSDFLPNQCQA